MDLTFSESEEAFRAEAREWLSTNVPRDLPSCDTSEGFALHLEWERLLHSAGWAVVSWPAAFGGRDASLWEWLIFEEEYYRAGGPPRVTQNGLFLLAPTLFRFGTEQQQAEILPRMAAARDTWCQGWSEPGAGSDLAGITSRAVRDEQRGGWRLTGQKTWVTRGAFCTHVFGLFRSEPGSERHRGLTYFMLPLDTPGVSVRGFGRLDGDEGFADVYFDDAFVSDSGVLGAPGAGWDVAMSAIGSGRSITLRTPGRFSAAAERLLELARERRATPVSADRVVQAWMSAEAFRLFTLKQATGIVEGRDPGPAASLSKLAWSELDVAIHEAALDLLGPEAELDGAWSRGFLFSLGGSIYGGASEIQRNIVAERVLGLPRR